MILELMANIPSYSGYSVYPGSLRRLWEALRLIFGGGQLPIELLMGDCFGPFIFDEHESAFEDVKHEKLLAIP